MKLKNIAASTLAAASVLGSAIPALAESKYVNSEEAVDYYAASNEIEGPTTVLAEVYSNFNVTIPKTVVLNGISKKASFDIKVSGDIAGDEIVTVKPDETITLSEESENKADVTGTVTSQKTTWNVDEAEQEVVSSANEIKATDLTAGSWSGVFNFNISIEGGEYTPLSLNGVVTEP